MAYSGMKIINGRKWSCIWHILMRVWECKGILSLCCLIFNIFQKGCVQLASTGINWHPWRMSVLLRWNWDGIIKQIEGNCCILDIWFNLEWELLCKCINTHWKLHFSSTCYCVWTRGAKWGSLLVKIWRLQCFKLVHSMWHWIMIVWY